MAATDKNYRNQYTLDIVFAVSNILMLVSIVAMFVQDFNREYKQEQRRFRDVESAIAQRLALEQAPSAEEIAAAEKRVKEAQEARKAKIDEIDKLKAQIADNLPMKEKSEKGFQDVKSELESRISFYNIEIEHHGLSDKAKSYAKDIERLSKDLEKVQAERDLYASKVKEAQQQILQNETPLTEALAAFKKVNDKFDAQVNLALKKEWRLGDTIRSFPVLDSFAPPIKIQQFTINDIPIDYNFKQVTRFDRCMTCHQGIDRPAYTKGMLKSLVDKSEDQVKQLKDAQATLKKRRDALKDLPSDRRAAEEKATPRPDDLELTTIHKSYLTEARINEFCAHPRLDLFVGANSKHPAEAFGCTSCHSGQGSATSFTLAAHSPDHAAAKDRWVKEHGWESQHMWDFPMLPQRFVESSCLKCHHQVTDLIDSNNQNQAPKVLRGYNLIKELGCFGCHEIPGRKGGRQIGPDLRLEPYPPLEDLTPIELTKAMSDPENPPGTLRKVGPSLFRLAEKTNAAWTAKWIKAPREFRPDTKMPHFYGLSNNDPNDPEALPPEQKDFPDTEVQAISYFLFKESEKYVSTLDRLHKEKPGAASQDQARLKELQNEKSDAERQGKKLDRVKRRDMEEIARRIDLRGKLAHLPLLTDPAPEYDGNAEKGRQLFSERGCLACHSHNALEKPQATRGDALFAPQVHGEATFGPNLSQVAEKLGNPLDPKAARRWLRQWILDPHQHSPRSRMPVTHMTPNEVADVAAWLLAQTNRPTMDLGPAWKDLEVKDTGKLKELADVYLVRLLTAQERKELKDKGQISHGLKDLPEDEQDLLANYQDDNLKYYLGKKAVTRLGCFACHDIPGLETAKPIGVVLNDWGKKDSGRLAFEDIKNYVQKKFHIVDSLVDKDGKPVGKVNDKEPYEKFYAESLFHHGREGYLNQKIRDPRSYDYKRLRTWDDRARMPQFKFARPHRLPGEDDAAYEARSFKEEADAREAVATFILGLVADPVPLKSIHQPKGDRLAEIKGRQILDKYNCAGCHLVRAGVVEFKVNDAVTTSLEKSFGLALTQFESDHFFANHILWEGKTPSDRLTAFGIIRPKPGGDGGEPPSWYVRLSQALRFQGEDKSWKDLRAFSNVFIQSETPPGVPLEQMAYPPKEAFASQRALDEFLKDKGPFGGAFADLLVAYLSQKDPKNYPTDPTGDSSNARVAVPPILLGQGERTQPEWLYQFLLDPQPVRKMTVLRMPKFNMSQDEARALVDYFSAVTRLTNPGVGLSHPYDAIPQKEEFDSPSWRKKNADYVRRLKDTKDKDGKPVFAKRVDDMKPLWQLILKDYEDQKEHAKGRLDQAPAATKPYWEAELKRLEKVVQDNSLEGQQKSWESQDAYVTDAYRLLGTVCTQCHQVGPVPLKLSTEGPPLPLAEQRLRPGWTQRWISNPQRHLTYISVMPNNFPANDPAKFQEVFAGTPQDRVVALRDALMSYPRVAAMPLNRYWVPPPPAPPGEKK